MGPTVSQVEGLERDHMKLCGLTGVIMSQPRVSTESVPSSQALDGDIVLPASRGPSSVFLGPRDPAATQHSKKTRVSSPRQPDAEGRLRSNLEAASPSDGGRFWRSPVAPRQAHTPWEGRREERKPQAAWLSLKLHGSWSRSSWFSTCVCRALGSLQGPAVLSRNLQWQLFSLFCNFTLFFDSLVGIKFTQ